MRVERFSKEILKVGDIFIAMPLIHSIEPITLHGSRGHGEVYYGFQIKGGFGDKGITNIFGGEVEYWRVSREELGHKEEEHPIYVDAKVEILTIRDEVVQFWSEYLEGKDK